MNSSADLRSSTSTMSKPPVASLPSSLSRAPAASSLSLWASRYLGCSPRVSARKAAWPGLSLVLIMYGIGVPRSLRCRCGGPGAVEDALRRAQMRAVEHLAVEADDAGIRVGGKGGDPLACPGDGGVAGREGAVDGGDLAGMDRRLGGEAGAPGGARPALQTCLGAKIGQHGVDRRDAGRRRAEQ